MRFAIVLARGGHFASSVFDLPGGLGTPKRDLPEAVAHSTSHRYVSRAQAGGRQSGKDASKSIKSAGSQLRRHNETALAHEMVGTLASWQGLLNECDAIFIQLSQPDEKAILHCDNPPFTKADPRVRRIPFPTRRPTYNETKRSLQRLLEVSIVDTPEPEQPPPQRDATPAQGEASLDEPSSPWEATKQGSAQADALEGKSKRQKERERKQRQKRRARRREREHVAVDGDHEHDDEHRNSGPMVGDEGSSSRSDWVRAKANEAVRSREGQASFFFLKLCAGGWDEEAGGETVFAEESKADAMLRQKRAEEQRRREQRAKAAEARLASLSLGSSIAGSFLLLFPFFPLLCECPSHLLIPRFRHTRWQHWRRRVARRRESIMMTVGESIAASQGGGGGARNCIREVMGRRPEASRPTERGASEMRLSQLAQPSGRKMELMHRYHDERPSYVIMKRNSYSNNNIFFFPIGLS